VIRKFLSNLLVNPFATAVAIWAVVTLVRAIVQPDTTSTAEIVPTVIYYIWAGMYCLGGLFLLFGQGVASPKYSAVGCVLFAEGAFVSAMSVIFNPIAGYWPGIESLLLGIAALIRFKHLIRGEMLTWYSARISFTDSSPELKEKQRSKPNDCSG
jgi:hypothetical protein